MATINAPEGMMTVEEFAKRKGTTADKVTKMIKDGFYVGRVIDGQWFVDQSELQGQTAKKTSGDQSSKLGYKSDYEPARKISKLMIVLGWLTVGLSIIGFLVITAGASQTRYGGGIALVSLAPVASFVVYGLFLVAAGYVTRATVDNADHSREMLAILKSRN